MVLTKDEALSLQEMLRTRGGKLLRDTVQRDYNGCIDRLLTASPDDVPALIGQARALKAQLAYLQQAERFTNDKG